MPTLKASDAIERLENLPEQLSELMPDALEAGAKVAQQAMRSELLKQKLYDTGQLYGSIAPGKPYREMGEHKIDIWPQGRRSRKFTKATGGKHGHRQGEAQTNAEVGFILEHGSDDRSANGLVINARHWMENAVEDAKEAILDTIEDALFDNFEF